MTTPAVPAAKSPREITARMQPMTIAMILPADQCRAGAASAGTGGATTAACSTPAAGSDSPESSRKGGYASVINPA
jgi:hypothetical protein